jgi:anti-anti-sigma factor
MSVLASVSEQQHGDIAVALVAGEVDASNRDELRQRLRAMLTNRSFALVVDLSATTYLDSAGINLLFELAADLSERQQRLHLVLPPGAIIARAIAITGLDVAAPAHPSLEEALAAARSADAGGP